MTRHPVTGHLIENEAEWKDSKQNWLDVERTEAKDNEGKVIGVSYKPIPEKVEKKKENK